MINQTILQGRLTADPELKQTQSGVPVCSFTVAWSEKYNETETKLFLDCTAWRGTAELVSKHFTKGKEIIVSGKLHTEQWQDKEGNKRSTIRMTVDAVHFCGKKEDGATTVPTVQYTRAIDQLAAAVADVAVGDDELPF